MWGNVPIWLGLSGATVLLGWLTLRAWRAWNKAVKWLSVFVISQFDARLGVEGLVRW